MDSGKLKIVIIEDEKILIDVLAKKFDNEGYQVFKAEDGESGLALIERVKPDMVLLDIIMPRMNGYEVLTALNEKYGKDHMPPVIVISNSGQPVEIDRARELGAKDFIVKAVFTPEEVISKVVKILELSTTSPARRAAAQAEAGTAPQAVPAESSTHVLIIEDDQFLRDLLKTKLEKEKFHVTTAIDGPSGIEKVLNNRPEIILLDIILPGIDGFEILQRVRTNSKMQIANIPIILLSNLGQEADVEKGRNLGADDYLIKSNFTIDEIIEKIRRVLEDRANR